MNKLTKISFFIILSINSISCKKEITKENIQPTEVNINNKEKEALKLQDNLKYKEKIFLKYWEGMTYSEFYDVSSILETEGKTKIRHGDFYYNVGETSLKITPLFDKSLEPEVLVGLKLTGFTEESYKLYIDKYNFPKYSFKEVEYILESNPLLSTQSDSSSKDIDEYTIGNRISNLTYKEAQDIVYNDSDYSRDFIELHSIATLFALKTIVIPNEAVFKNNRVIVKASMTKVDFPITITKKASYKRRSVRFVYPNENNKSKNRVVVKHEDYELSIMYLSESFFRNELLINENFKKEILENSKRKKDKLNQVLEDI